PVAKSGNGYGTGKTRSIDFPTASPFQGNNNASAALTTNAFVSKLNATGTGLVYSTYLGGSGNGPTGHAIGDWGTAIAVDSSGSAYVIGHASSPDFPTFNAFQSIRPDPGGSSFVSKLSPSGASLVYSTYFGPAATKSIAVDGSGDAYVTGQAGATSFPIVNAFQS